MKLQLEGLCWSIGIHGIFLLTFILLQPFVVAQDKMTVIDFTFSADSALPVIEPTATPQAAARSIVSRPKPKISTQENISHIAQASPFPEKMQEETAEQSLSPVPQKSEENRQISATADKPPAASSYREAGAEAGPLHPPEGRTDAYGTLEQTPEQSRTAYLKEHFAYIRNRITGRILYPEMARKMGWCGQVKLAFVVCEDGGVIDVRVVDSSGFRVLDHNAIATVKNVAPFPKPPVKAEIRMAVTYRLN